VSHKLDSYDRFIWIKRVLKIHRTMAVLEQQKHLKPFMSQAVLKLIDVLKLAGRSAKTEKVSNESCSDENVTSAMSSAEFNRKAR